MHFNLHALALLMALAWSQSLYADQANGCSSFLTAAQVEVLQTVTKNTNHYTIKLLTKEIAGKTKAVVILGEAAHTKGQQDSQLGKQTLNQFLAYGIESASPAATWGGRVLAWPANYARSRGWLRQREEFPVTTMADGKRRILASEVSVRHLRLANCFTARASSRAPFKRPLICVPFLKNTKSLLSLKKLLIN